MFLIRVFLLLTVRLILCRRICLKEVLPARLTVIIDETPGSPVVTWNCRSAEWGKTCD